MNRVRNELSDPALAYLALTFANLDRASLAGELLGILGPRAKTEATAPGPAGSRLLGQFAAARQAVRGAAETTALVTPGLRPRPAPGRRARRRRRLAPGPPRRHRLAAAQGQGAGAGRAGVLLRPRPGRRGPLPPDRHRQRHPGRRARRHRRDRGQGDRRSASRRSRSASPTASGSTMEGRGRFGYAVTLAGFTRDFGPDQDRTNRVATVDAPGLSVRPHPSSTARCCRSGFGVAVNPTHVREPRQPGRARRQGPASRSRPGATSPRTRPNGSATS